MIKSQTGQFYLLAIFLAISVQSCASPNAQISPSSQSMPTQTAVPSAIEVPPTAIPTPSIPFTFVGWSSQCWTIKPLEKGSGIKGRMLFWNFEDQSNFVWDVNSFHVRKLEHGSLSPHDKISSYSISRDGSLLTALFQSDSESQKEYKVVLISPTQTKEYSLPQLPERQYYRSAWFLPNGRIAIRISYSDEYSIQAMLESEYSPKTGYAYLYYLLDPVTGNLTLNSVLLKEFEFGSRLDRVPVEFSPDMEYVVFRTASYADNSDKFALMNAKTGAILWTGSYMPRWKSDGSALTSLGDNLYTLSRDGKITQITNFKEKKTFIGLGVFHNVILWSPDARYVAFQEALPSINQLLYIWDDQEKVAYRPCLPDELRAYTDYYPRWSLDGKYLLVDIVYPDAPLSPNDDRTPPTHGLMVILDMENQIIYTLPDENNRGQYGLLAPNGASIVDWINWELP